MKRLLRRTLNKLGFDVVRTRNSHSDQARHLSNVLASKRIDCVIDVGANAGQYGMFLRGLGYAGHIVSFEPVKSVFDALKSKADSDGKWTCHNFALGDRTEEKTLNVYPSTVFSSFLPASTYSKKIWSSLQDATPERVKVFRLDDVYEDLVAGLGCKNPMLKLDTQGYDKHVFDGARASLKNISALQSELSLIPVYDGAPQAYDVLGEFHKNGFYISGMYPINRDESLAVIEFDCVLVKRETSPSM
jgi:FkbM family methyltransferase